MLIEVVKWTSLAMCFHDFPNISSLESSHCLNCFHIKYLITVFVNFAVSLSLFLILQVETICDMMLCQMDFLG